MVNVAKFSKYPTQLLFETTGRIDRPETAKMVLIKYIVETFFGGGVSTSFGVCSWCCRTMSSRSDFLQSYPILPEKYFGSARIYKLRNFVGDNSRRHSEKPGDNKNFLLQVGQSLKATRVSQCSRPTDCCRFKFVTTYPALLRMRHPTSLNCQTPIKTQPCSRMVDVAKFFNYPTPATSSYCTKLLNASTNRRQQEDGLINIYCQTFLELS